MSIEHDPKTHAPIIVIGDGDTLTGGTAIPDVVRLWIAPRAANDQLQTNVVTPAADMTPPGNEVVTVYFVSRPAIDGYIEMLTKMRDNAFPSPEPTLVVLAAVEKPTD